MEIEVKLYDFSGKFKKQINSKNISSDIEFQEELNGGQGNLSLKIEGNIDDFKESDIIEIRDSEIGNLYTGIIEKKSIREYENANYITLTLYGVFTALNDILYKSGGNRTFTKTDTIGNIIKSIIDSFNVDYGSLFGDTQILQNTLLRYTIDSINASDTISVSFDNQNCLESIKKVLNNTDYSFFISREGIIYVKKRDSESLKFLTFGKDIVFIERETDKKDLKNKLYLKRNGGTEFIYEDIVSQDTFNLKEKFQSNTDLQNETTQNFFGNNFISENKNPDNIVQIEVKGRNDLQPGFLISTMNSENNIIEKQITKIDFRKDTNIIYLGNFQSFGKKITQR